MNVSDLISEKEKSISTILHKFILSVGTYPDDLFCFFEGKDSPYYSFRIETYYVGNFHPFVCKGKKRVLKIWKILEAKSEYSKYKKAYFVDKDFDSSLKGKSSSLYETPSYSIDNLYSTEGVLKRILRDEFGLNEIDKSFKKCIKTFQKRQNEFHESCLLFNAWYACLKESSKKQEKSTNVNLEDNLPKGFVSLDMNKIKPKYDLDEIKRTFPEAISYETTDLDKKIRELKKIDQQKFFRGKYEIQFMYWFLRKLINDANHKEKQNYIPNKTKFNLDRAQFISQLSQYAETPDCLIYFIRSYN